MSKETEKKTTRTRTRKNTPPKTEAKSSVVTEGTNPEGPRAITVTDKYGNVVEVEAGTDGENPISPNNPPKNAMLDGDRA